MALKIVLKLKNPPKESIVKDGNIAKEIIEFPPDCPKEVAIRQILDHEDDMISKYLDFELIDESETGE